MHDTKNENLLVLEKIDDPILSKDHFARIFPVKFWNNPANSRIVKERFSVLDEAIV